MYIDRYYTSGSCLLLFPQEVHETATVMSHPLGCLVSGGLSKERWARGIFLSICSVFPIHVPYATVLDSVN